MDIAVCTAKDQDAWRRELASRLPGATIHVGVSAPACDYALVFRPPGTFFHRQRALKAVFSLGAGVNTLLAMPELPADVPLVRMEDGGLPGQIVEYALYVALRAFRRFHLYERDQSQRTWKPLPARRREDFAVGVLGLGAMGGAVAEALAGFGFAVSGWSARRRHVDGVRSYCGPDGLREVLARSELLVVLLPLTDGTIRLLDRERLGLLPRGACVANLSRGPLIDDDALLHLLDDGHIAEASLDVFATEPLPADARYWHHPAVRMTPHIAALTDPARGAEHVADKIRRLERGLPISGVVDRTRQY